MCLFEQENLNAKRIYCCSLEFTYVEKLRNEHGLKCNLFQFMF